MTETEFASVRTTASSKLVMSVSMWARYFEVILDRPVSDAEASDALARMHESNDKGITYGEITRRTW